MINFIKKVIRHLRLLKLFPDSKIHFGSLIDRSSTLSKCSVIFPNVVLQNSNIGAYTYIQVNSVLSSTEVGKFCSIASNVHIGIAGHPTHMLSTHPTFYDNTQPLPFFFTNKKVFSPDNKQTKINADVWIGQSAILMPGINIGVGAIIAAGSVVTKDVEAYSIVGGVPAKHIKYRFDKELREALLETKWWTLDDEKLTEITPLFTDPKKMVETLKNN